LQGCCDSVGAQVKACAGREGICHQDNAIGEGMVAEAVENLAPECALQRDIAKLFQLVVPQQQAHNPVAEGAHAVVEENRPAFHRNVLCLCHVLMICPLILERCLGHLPIRAICSFVLKNSFLEALTRLCERFVLLGVIHRL